MVLSNRSSKSGRIVTADAVKIGGGYGNIARRVSPWNSHRKQEKLWCQCPCCQHKITANRLSLRNKAVIPVDLLKLQDIGCNGPVFPTAFIQKATGKTITRMTINHVGYGLIIWRRFLQQPQNDKGLNIPVDMAFCISFWRRYNTKRFYYRNIGYFPNCCQWWYLC